MAMWTSPDDVYDRWFGSPITADDEQVDVLLSDVEDLIRREFPELEDRVAAGQIPEERVVRVVVRVASRVLRNPHGYRQVNSGTGPFTGSATYGGDNPGEMYLSNDDRADLGGRTRYRRARAFTIYPGGLR